MRKGGNFGGGGEGRRCSMRFDRLYIGSLA